ncbi:MAG TPA: hypothetical protein VFZ35_08940 [Sphingomicrobium sp.]
MDVRFEVELTREEYVVGLHSLTGELVKSDTKAKQRIFERLAAITLLILVTGYFQPRAMLGLLFLIIGYMLIEWLMARRWTHSVHGVSFDPAVGPVRLEFSAGGISETSAHRSRRWDWPAVRRIHERESAIVFEMIGWDMLVLPNRLWPDGSERSRFLTEALGQQPGKSDELLSTVNLPGAMTSDLFHVAAIAAFVDVCLILVFVMPPILRPMALDLGVAGMMVIVMIIAAALGFVAYRAATSGLPRLHASSPLAAKVVAQCLIWAFAVWFVAASLKLF